MPFTRSETTLQGTWNLSQLTNAIKTAFAQLTNTELFDEYDDTTKSYLVFKITYDATKPYGSAFIRIHITKSNFSTQHSVATGWNASTHTLVGFESALSTATILIPSEALYIQTFDNPTNKEGKIVSLTHQGSQRNFMIFVANPQQYRDPDLSSDTKFLFATNAEHQNNKTWNLPNNNSILAYQGCSILTEQPNYIDKGNLSGNESRVITGISLFPTDNPAYITAVIFGIFTVDIAICFGNNVNAGSTLVTNNGTYYLVTKVTGQTYAIRCE